VEGDAKWERRAGNLNADLAPKRAPDGKRGRLLYYSEERGKKHQCLSQGNTWEADMTIAVSKQRKWGPNIKTTRVCITGKNVQEVIGIQGLRTGLGGRGTRASNRKRMAPAPQE